MFIRAMKDRDLTVMNSPFKLKKGCIYEAEKDFPKRLAQALVADGTCVLPKIGTFEQDKIEFQAEEKKAMKEVEENKAIEKATENKGFGKKRGRKPKK